MARANKESKNTSAVGYNITVKDNPNFCGIGAGGVQFAYGKATIAKDSAIVNWYKEHDGYEVTEIPDETADTAQDTEA